MTWIAGADGFKGRWFVVLWQPDAAVLRTRVVDTFAELLVMPEDPVIVTVDIPIGLPETTMAGGRACEQAARKVLGRRASSVFSAVGREALKSAQRIDAHRVSVENGGIGFGAQAWGLAQKLREADLKMTPAHQARLREVHPEVSFWAMQDGVPVLSPKKTSIGAAARVDLLVKAGLPRQAIDDHLVALRSGHDDFLDTCAAVWTADRIKRGKAGRFPDAPQFDARGLDMAIWF